MKGFRFPALWGLLMLGAFTSSVQASPCGNPSDQSYSTAWSGISFSTALGNAGFSAFDYNADGVDDLLLSSGHMSSSLVSEYWFTLLSFDTDTNDYQVVCQSSVYTEEITKLTTFQSDAGTYVSLIAIDDGYIDIFDHNLGISVGQVSTSNRSVNDLLVADIDNDGEREFVALTDNFTMIFNLNSYELEQTLSWGGSAFGVGHITTDSELQLAISSGVVLTIQGSSTEVTWDYTATGFASSLLEVGDINNDGFDEILGVNTSLTAYSGISMGSIWSVPPNNIRFEALSLYDQDNDGALEIFTGDDQWGELYILDGESGATLVDIPNDNHGVTDIIAGDFNGDSSLDVVWGSGYSSSGADYLYIYTPESSSLEWQSGEYSGPYLSIDLGDITGDGIADFIYASIDSESGYSSGILRAIDGTTLTEIWTADSQVFPETAYLDIHDISIADIDNDSTPEVLVATRNVSDGYLYVIDAATGALEAEVLVDDDLQAIYSIKFDDIDDDGHKEILLGGASGKIFKLDAETLTLTDQYIIPDISDPIWLLESADINSDGINEIIAITDNLVVIDLAESTIHSTALEPAAISIINDATTDEPIVYLATESGALGQLNEDFSSSTLIKICDDSLQAIEAIDDQTLAIICDGQVGTFDLTTNTTSWQEDTGDTEYLGIHDRLLVHHGTDTIQLFMAGIRPTLLDTSDKTSPLIAGDSSEAGPYNAPLHGQFNAQDNSAEAVTYAIYHQPENGAVTIPDPLVAEFIYTPTGDNLDPVEFDYFMTDGTDYSGLGTVTIDLSNTAPVCSDDEFSLHWNNVLQASMAASDDDGDDLTYELLSRPAYGTVTLADQSSGDFTFTISDAGFNWQQFSFWVTDGQARSSRCWIQIFITNADPTAPDLTLDTDFATGLSAQLNGTDADDDAIIYQLEANAATGNASLTEDGLLSYEVSGEDASYQDTVQYRVYDGRNWSSIGTVYINVTGTETEDGSDDSSDDSSGTETGDGSDSGSSDSSDTDTGDGSDTDSGDTSDTDTGDSSDSDSGDTSDTDTGDSSDSDSSDTSDNDSDASDDTSDSNDSPENPDSSSSSSGSSGSGGGSLSGWFLLVMFGLLLLARQRSSQIRPG
ncbi:FG-GAP-like repeat-containing protein [Oceanobacter mangrovi]|uniref:FG-GAP-like repeat-containing protein n=1 Tax=Oceanobacter mangrovi TaxID=2862510 RepID=UPI001C8DBA52|nr:FG-GAP-like repeat-containing protein [Oceanobacter mangrovi]